jgi:pyruvate dehydrogenase E1 component beta subunit
MEAGITGDRESRAAARQPKSSRTIFDKPWGSQGAQHSQSPEGMLCSVPGLEVVCPSTPADAAGLLRSAIDSDNPTFLIEHRDLLFTKGQVGPASARVPLGKAAIRRRGKDVLVIAHSVMVGRSLEAAERLRTEHGVHAEVLDLRSLAPLDKETILERVSAIGRVVLVEQGRRSFGVAAGVASVIVEEAFRELKEPIGFVCTADTPIPFSPSLLDAVTPSVDTIVERVMGTIAGSRNQAAKTAPVT